MIDVNMKDILLTIENTLRADYTSVLSSKELKDEIIVHNCFEFKDNTLIDLNYI